MCIYICVCVCVFNLFHALNPPPSFISSIHPSRPIPPPPPQKKTHTHTHKTTRRRSAVSSIIIHQSITHPPSQNPHQKHIIHPPKTPPQNKTHTHTHTHTHTQAAERKQVKEQKEEAERYAAKMQELAGLTTEGYLFQVSQSAVDYF